MAWVTEVKQACGGNELLGTPEGLPEERVVSEKGAVLFRTRTATVDLGQGLQPLAIATGKNNALEMRRRLLPASVACRSGAGEGTGAAARRRSVLRRGRVRGSRVGTGIAISFCVLTGRPEHPCLV